MITTRIGPVAVELRSDLRDAAEDFAILYGRCPGAGPSAGTIQMAVRAAGRKVWGARRYSIVGDGQEVFGNLRTQEVFPYLEWGINHRVIARHGEYLQLHAAVLSWKGWAVMLVGPSGCGKSTLTAALAARGWGYLSDEFALIDPESLHVHPFPKALCIKAGAFELVRRLGLPLWCRRPYVKAFKGRVGYISPHEVQVESRPFPIRLIVFPRYRGGGRLWVGPVARGQAAYVLAANAFNGVDFGERLVVILGELVRGAPCVALEPGRLDEACTLLETRLLASEGG